MRIYYGDNDPYVCEWLENLVTAGELPNGVVECRNIREIEPAELDRYEQVHLFAGIGGWPLALKIADWRGPCWTGSCPCQPFSTAGRRKGFDDERDLWPAFFALIRECRPVCVFGEQVSGKAGYEWLARVHADLDGAGYAVGAADLPAACVGAPHIRQRLFWVADAPDSGRRARDEMDRSTRGEQPDTAGDCAHGRVADADEARREGRDRPAEPRAATGEGARSINPRRNGAAGGLGHADRPRLEGQPGYEPRTGGGPHPQRHGSPAGPWSDFDFVACADGKARRIESGTFPLAPRVSGRVALERTVRRAGTEVQETHWYAARGALRGLGNAIVPQVAAEFIQAYKD